jgi:hypothetical protein
MGYYGTGGCGLRSRRRGTEVGGGRGIVVVSFDICLALHVADQGCLYVHISTGSIRETKIIFKSIEEN